MKFVVNVYGECACARVRPRSSLIRKEFVLTSSPSIRQVAYANTEEMRQLMKRQLTGRCQITLLLGLLNATSDLMVKGTRKQTNKSSDFITHLQVVTDSYPVCLY